MRRRIGIRLLVFAIALATVGCRQARKLPVLKDGGDFTLTDHNGQPFELSSLRGKAVLIFFGYTSCPDVCPTTLSKLSEVYKRMGEDSKRVKTLYITVDPGRDTPAILKDDLSNFEVDALGLTGTKAEIDKVVALYGAKYEIVPLPDSAAKYSVSHTATLYALDTSGRTRLEFPYDAKVEEIVAGLKAILASRA
jgi:protein SCO1/2